MAVDEKQTRQTFAALSPGDRIEIVHDVKVGQKTWQTTVIGTVVRTDRFRHGLHFQRNTDDKVFSDIIVLKCDDEELTTITVDEFTAIRKLPPQR